jgi:hypothetical protein
MYDSMLSFVRIRNGEWGITRGQLYVRKQWFVYDFGICYINLTFWCLKPITNKSFVKTPNICDWKWWKLSTKRSKTCDRKAFQIMFELDAFGLKAHVPRFESSSFVIYMTWLGKSRVTRLGKLWPLGHFFLTFFKTMHK